MGFPKVKDHGLKYSRSLRGGLGRALQQETATHVRGGKSSGSELSSAWHYIRSTSLTGLAGGGTVAARRRGDRVIAPLSLLRCRDISFGSTARITVPQHCVRFAPNKQTPTGRVQCDATCTKADPCSATKGARLFDHLVGAKDDRVWNFKPDRLGSFHIEHKLETCCLIHRQISRCSSC
jgi:hypothetical protein